jgi:hypothetical protein
MTHNASINRRPAAMPKPTTKEVAELLRKARMLRRHYDLACAYIAQDPQIMSRMFDELLDMRRECDEDTTPYERLTVELHHYKHRHAGTFWTGSRMERRRNGAVIAMPKPTAAISPLPPVTSRRGLAILAGSV